MQGLMLPVLLKVMPEKWILVTALIASTFELLGFVVAPVLGTWAVFLTLLVGAPGSMAFPVISALKSVHAGPEEQGKVQVQFSDTDSVVKCICWVRWWNMAQYKQTS